MVMSLCISTGIVPVATRRSVPILIREWHAMSMLVPPANSSEPSLTLVRSGFSCHSAFVVCVLTAIKIRLAAHEAFGQPNGAFCVDPSKTITIIARAGVRREVVVRPYFITGVTQYLPDFAGREIRVGRQHQ